MIDDFISWLKDHGWKAKNTANAIKELRQHRKILHNRSEELYRIETALNESLRKKAGDRNQELGKQLDEKYKEFHKEVWECFHQYLYETILQQLTEEES